MSTVARLFIAALFFTCASWAADLTGIWMGESPGKNGEKQDIAFRFQTTNGAVTGVMFGDEIDLPLQELHLDGDRISFSVTSKSYNGGRATRTVFTGTVTATTLELTREQAAAETAPAPDKPKEAKPTLKLKRLT